MLSLRLALLAVLALALKRGFELVLENEYATWAPALARLLVRVAGSPVAPLNTCTATGIPSALVSTP